MSQRLALLKLYNGLALDPEGRRPRSEERFALLEQLGILEFVTLNRGQEVLRFDDLVSAGDEVSGFNALLDEVAGSEDAEAGEVLEIEKLEFLVKLSHTFQFVDDVGTLSEAVDVSPSLRRLVAGVANPGLDDPVAILANGIDDVAGRLLISDVTSDDLVDLDDIDPRMAQIVDRRNSEPSDFDFADFEGQVAEGEVGGVVERELVGAAAMPVEASIHYMSAHADDGTEASATELLQQGHLLNDEAMSQPTTDCETAFVSVKVDGQGEVATYLKTEIVYPPGALPGVTLQDLQEDVLNPTKWHDCHDFWCDMTQLRLGKNPTELDALGAINGQIVDAAWPDEFVVWERVGAATVSAIDAADTAAAAGDDQYRLGPREDDLFPLTFLAFRLISNVFGQPDQRVLEYRVITQQRIDDIPQLAIQKTALGVDDGWIAISELPDRSFRIETVKVLHVRQGASHQLHALAEFACEAGWVTNTRKLIEQCVK